MFGAGDRFSLKPVGLNRETDQLAGDIVIHKKGSPFLFLFSGVVRVTAYVSASFHSEQ